MRTIIVLGFVTLLIGACTYHSEEELYGSLINDTTDNDTTDSVMVVSFVNDIQPILENKCTFDGCHGNNHGFKPDWRIFENVQTYASTIKEKTQNKSMPKTGSLTQLQIDLIAEWVDDGALNN